MQTVKRTALAAGVAAMVMLSAAAASAETSTAPAATAEAFRAPTIEQLAAYPALASLTVSPDGRRLAAVQSRGEERVVTIWDATNLSNEPRNLGAQHMKVQGVQFVKNGVVAISAWQPFESGSFKTFASKLYLINVDGGAWNDPLTTIQTRSESEREQLSRSSARVLDTLPNDPDHILISVGSDIYKYNVRRHRSERVLRSGERVNGYDTDLNGDLRARSRAGRDGNGLYVATEFRNAAGAWEEHVRNYVKDREVFSVAGFSKDPNIAFVVSNRERDKAAILEYDIAARRLGEVAFSHPLFEATGVSVWDIPGDNFGEIASFSYAGLRGETYPVLPELEALTNRINAALGIQETPIDIVDPATGQHQTIPYKAGKHARIVSASRDLNTIIVWAGSANDPGAYYLLRNKEQLTVLSQPYPDIAPAALGATSYATYAARDGQLIPAFVTRPNAEQFGPGPYPTVIMPHGGPWARDDMEWDGSMWPALLASRGYAIIQPQFRGSSGWGTALWRAGDGEWGQKMQDDLDDAVVWAQDQGLAKQGHVAMFGFSYGGYAAMVAAVRPNGLYKCAIAGAGVSDLSRIRDSLLNNPYTREAQRDTVKGLSPSSVANTISIPIMLYHGERDQTAPIEHSEWFVDKARSSGQDVQFTRLTDYGHGNAWTRAIMAQQLGLIDTYFRDGCNGGL